MDDSLFSHPVESEFVTPTYDGSSDPVENPVFSDQQR
jgi:hypothetical protein